MRSSLCLLTIWQATSQRHLPRANGVLQVDSLKSPEAEALSRARQSWTTPHHRFWNAWDESKTKAFDQLLAARKFGPHQRVFQAEPASHFEGVSSLFRGLATAQWCFLGVVMGMLLTMVWVCAGAAAGTTWLFGYLMELLLSADHALYLAMISSMVFRLFGFLHAPITARCFSWILGTGLVYAGISRLNFQRLEQCPDVTESMAVLAKSEAFNDVFLNSRLHSRD
eukprot:Skav223901  [mRNA]  locus=scaffold2113:81305:98847:+ [translate_table: standard]